MNTLKFGYPRRGLSGEFATFRLGARAAQQYTPGTVVELVDSRSSKLLKRATVTAVHVGVLSEMAQQHSHMAHNWRDHDPAQRSDLLIGSMCRRYPPDRCKETSVVSVLYLKEEPQ